MHNGSQETDVEPHLVPLDRRAGDADLFIIAHTHS